MSGFFRAFNRIAGQKQRAVMAFRPQANGFAVRMVQTLTRALKMVITDLNQQGWDEYAERLPFASNTAHHRVRSDNPFYLLHGYDPQSTLEANLLLRRTKTRGRTGGDGVIIYSDVQPCAGHLELSTERSHPVPGRSTQK